MKIFKIFILSVGTVFFTSSCQKFVQIDLPKSQMVRQVVFKDYSTANAAMVQIYSNLRDRVVLGNTGIADLTKIMGMYADELVPSNASSAINSNNYWVYSNNLVPSHSYVGSVWDNSYFMIYGANSIIEGLTNMQESQVSSADRDKLIGEALFLRTFVNFYLTNLFGNIPYVTSTDYTINNKLSRLEKKEVLKNLEEDLKKAISLLPEAYADTERVRPNASTARALLARIYLYQEKWKQAADMAKEVLDTISYGLVEDISSVFLKNSQETIWQLSPNGPIAITAEAGFYILVTAPPPAVSLSDELVSSFEPMDKRLKHWVGQIEDTKGTKFYFAHKYQRRVATGTQNEFSIQIRLAEIYLIRAEAKAHLDDLEGATTDLNKIRERAGLAHLNSTNKDEILLAILEERNRELFLEYPHRFFDLVRTGNTQILAAAKSGWDATDVLWPIPESEILVNPNLAPQNLGY